MSNKPTLYAYAVKDRGRNQKAIWTRIGAAWPHEKGRGFTIELEAFPVDGRLVLTEPKSDDKAESPRSRHLRRCSEGGRLMNRSCTSAADTRAAQAALARLSVPSSISIATCWSMTATRTPRRS